MSERLSTAGMMLAYAVEETAGTRPTTGWKEVPEVKTLPSFNPSPSSIQSTTLHETEYHTYVKGLKDLGGALEYGANLTEDLLDFWDDMLEAYETATKAKKSMWFAVIHPKLTKATFFVGEPSPIGFNEADVDSMSETTLYITPNSAPEWGTKPAEIATVKAVDGVRVASVPSTKKSEVSV